MPVPAETSTLAAVAAALAAPGKGLLASDESVGTIGKRLEKAGLTNDEVGKQCNIQHHHSTAELISALTQQKFTACQQPQDSNKRPSHATSMSTPDK